MVPNMFITKQVFLAHSEIEDGAQAWLINDYF